jgi:hypothetical protein
MKLRTFLPLLAIALASPFVTAAAAQDRTPAGGEPVVASINPGTLTYDYLVDSSLTQDDPANRRFKTLQAAYEAAPEGTEHKPTVIGIKPGVHFLPGGPPRTPSLKIRKHYITFLGLTNNRRAVVLADNRGLMQGAEDNGYILDVDATGFTLRNLTVLNYCNTDYEYPGDPSKNLTKRSGVITQAVALVARGDKHVYENVAFLSRLDTIFLITKRSYLENVYIEGTDDWVGGGDISVWENCTLVYPTGHGVMSAANVVFRNCRFEAADGMQWFKEEFAGAEHPVALINCVVALSAPGAYPAWIRGKAGRPAQYSLTYHLKDGAGKPDAIRDATMGSAAYTYSRELSDAEVLTFNPWNLLRRVPNGATDDWDPAGVRAKYEQAGDLVYRLTPKGGDVTIRTGGAGATLSATVLPVDAADPTIHWSTPSPLVALSQSAGTSTVVTGTNTTELAQWVPVHATASNGYRVTAHVYVEPRFIEPPTLAGTPTISAPANGRVSVSYTFASKRTDDESLITWAAADDASGTGARLLAVTRGTQPAKTLTLTQGMIGKYLRVSVRPKCSISEAGTEVAGSAPRPVAAADVRPSKVVADIRTFVTDENPAYVSGWWTVLGKWVSVSGETYVNGWGIRPTGTAGSLLYQQDNETGDMLFDVAMTTEKAEGQAFSIPGFPQDNVERSLFADIYIKYDPRTKNGYALRFWRTTQSATKCMFQFYKITNGIGAPLDDRQVLSGVIKPTARFTIRAVGSTLSVTARNTVDNEVLALESPYTPNMFGGAGIVWPRTAPNVFSTLEITYLK